MSILNQIDEKEKLESYTDFKPVGEGSFGCVAVSGSDKTVIKIQILVRPGESEYDLGEILNSEFEVAEKVLFK
jgi:uncharacterized protein YukJ